MRLTVRPRRRPSAHTLYSVRGHGTVYGGWRHEIRSLSPAAASLLLPALAGSPRRRRRKAGKGCSCSGSAANAGISHALVLGMSDILAKRDGSPSAARAVTSTLLRLAPLAPVVEPVR